MKKTEKADKPRGLRTFGSLRSNEMFFALLEASGLISHISGLNVCMLILSNIFVILTSQISVLLPLSKISH